MRNKPQLKMDFQRVKAKVQRVNDQAASRKEIGRTLMIPLEDIRGRQQRAQALQRSLD